MRKFFAAVALGLLCFAAQAASLDPDKILDQIEKSGAAMKSVQADFTRTRTIKASGKQIESEGTLYYTASDRMSMLYDKPAGEILIIDGKNLSMTRNGKISTYDTSKNSTMKTLRDILILCVQGNTRLAAERNNATYFMSETSEGYQVVLKATTATAQGYSSIILIYRKKDFVLTRMIMEDSAGIKTDYQMSGIVVGKEIDDAKFAVPTQSR